MQFDIKTDYVKQDNLAVDMCAACILFYRERQRPLRAIYLKPRYYALFRHWVSEQAGLEKALTHGYQFDGVNIEEGSNFQMDPLSVDFWPVVQAEA
jgi:hypothetical protein